MTAKTKKTFPPSDNVAPEPQVDTLRLKRLEGDIIVPGTTFRYKSERDEDSYDLFEEEPPQESGFGSLDPVSRLLWSQSLRSLH